MTMLPKALIISHTTFFYSLCICREQIDEHDEYTAKVCFYQIGDFSCPHKQTNKQKESFEEEEEDESGEGSSFDGDHGGREEEILRGVTVARVEDAHEHAERV